ncbi:MAG: MFS transporter [Bdellovibrionota bacterium]
MIWQNIFLAYISLFTLGLADNIRGPLYPEILRYFDLTNSTGSMVFAIFSLASFFGALSSTRLLRIWNLYQMLTFAAITMAVGLFVMSLSPSFYVLLFGSALVGFSFGPMGTSQNSLVVLGAEPVNRIRWMSGLHTCYGIASFLAPLIVAGVADYESPWRWGLGSVGIAAIILAVICFSIKKPAVPARVVPVDKGFGFLRREFHLTAVMSFYVIAEILVGSRLAQYMRLEMDSDLRHSSYAVTAFFVLMVVGRMATSFFHFPWKLRTGMVVSLVTTLLSLIAGMYIHPYFLILSGLTMAPFFAWIMTYVSTVFHHSVEKTISLALSLNSFFIVIMHMSVGQITDNGGIWWAMILAPVFILISLVLLITFKEAPVAAEAGANA